MHYITSYTHIPISRYFLQHTIHQPVGSVHRRKNGVSINGIPWHPGKYCLYRTALGATLLLGQVLTMVRATDQMENTFIIFHITNKPITSYHGHYCIYSDNNPTTTLVLWSLLGWKCKTMVLPSGSKMALPFASCTSRELAELD
jgi:hypothetical protein